MKKLIALGTVLCAVAASAAMAGHHVTGEAKPKKNHHATKIARMDMDKNGTVSMAEYIAHRTKYLEKQFAEMAGEDGELTADELKAYHAKKHGHHKAKMKEMKKETPTE